MYIIECVCMYVYIYIYTHEERERENDIYPNLMSCIGPFLALLKARHELSRRFGECDSLCASIHLQCVL